MGSADPVADERPTYEVIAERAGNSWFISVPSVPGALASTREHNRIEAIVRGVVARELGVPRDSFDLDIRSSER